ncbi:MAG: hypothetical protein IT371_26105 [Deltaproteobacteria bacterium]|nr:hypothetical protein [Deltaproteobacteria bacterium]
MGIAVRRGGLVSRAVALLALATLLAAAPAPRAAEPNSRGGSSTRPEVRLVDLPARVASHAKRLGPTVDYIDKYFDSPEVSVYAHVFGPQKTCPLHLHRTTRELTVVASGEARVRHVYGRGGRLAQSDGRFAAGVLIYSPPLCAHEWTNASTSAPLGVLVLALPRWDGNTRVAADDPRLAQAPPPLIHRSLARVAPRIKTNVHIEKLRVDAAETSELVLRAAWTAPAAPGESRVYFVVAGEGELEQGARYPLRPGLLAVVPSAGTTTRLRPFAGQTLVVRAFHIAPGTRPTPPAAERIP